MSAPAKIRTIRVIRAPIGPLAVAAAVTAILVAAFLAHHRLLNDALDRDERELLDYVAKVNGPAAARMLADELKDSADGRFPIGDEYRLRLVIDRAFLRAWPWAIPLAFAALAATGARVRRRPRLRVRTMMAVVAAAALLVPGWRWASAMAIRSHRYAELAHQYGEIERYWSKLSAELGDAFHREHVAHFAALRRKYERASRHPWLPVAPDPPEPK